MDQINIVWKSYHKPEVIDRGYWDNGLIEDIFKMSGLKLRHVHDVSEVRPGQGAVFIINGRTHVEDIKAINGDLSALRWVLFIVTGDEEALFPWQEVRHPMIRTWVMLPRMNQHNDVSFKIPNGYRPTTHDILGDVGFQDKTLDWFFAGQVNHDRREQCVSAAQDLLNRGSNGKLVTTDGFGKEAMPYPEYIKTMAQSKIVLCPSGIESPDNFRLYEALEAGCLPVVDAFATKNQSFGFWQYMFGENPPFPILNYWDKLPKLLPVILKDYPDNANRAYAWWMQYKRKMKNKLLDQIKELSK